MKTALHILKVGGHLVNDAIALQEVLTAFAGLKGAKLLVHGGGRHATALAKQLGISPKMVDGRRITDAAMLEVAVIRTPVFGIHYVCSFKRLCLVVYHCNPFGNSWI